MDKKPLLSYFYINKRIFFLLFLLVLSLVLLIIDSQNVAKAILPVPLKTAEDFYYYARLLNHKRLFTKSEKYLLKALALKPDFHKALIELGWVYMEQGDFIKAIPFFEKAIPIAKEKNDRSNYEIALYDLGKIYLYENMAEEAWKFLRQAYEAKNYLGEKFWPNDPKDAIFYVAQGNKEKFLEFVSSVYPEEIRNRIKRIQKRPFFLLRASLVDCERYIKDNPGSRYASDILLNKAYILQRLGDFRKAIKTLEEIDQKTLSPKQKEWFLYARYSYYYSLRQPHQTILALKELVKNYPAEYSPVWYLYQKALIAKQRGDYTSEKRYLLELLRKDRKRVCSLSSRRSCSELRYAALAKARLMEIYSVEGDYLSAAEIALSYLNPFRIFALSLGLVIFYGVMIFFLLAFSRIFFWHRTEEILRSPFRLRHLWLLCVIYALLFYALQTFFYAFNFFTNNLLGRLRLDPLLLTIISWEIITMVLGVNLLKKKYNFNNDSLGFIYPEKKYIFKIPLLLTIALFLIATAYGYFIDNVLHLPDLEYPLEGYINGILFKGWLIQKVMLVLSIVIVGPVTEEIFFRIFLFRFFNNYTNTFIAVTLSALAFAISHNAPTLIPIYFVFAVSLSWLYLKTKSIYPSIVCHSLYNLVGFVLPS